MTKYWQVGHKPPHMLNEGNFGLGKILKISKGKDSSGPCPERVFGLRPLIIVSVDGHGFGL